MIDIAQITPQKIAGLDKKGKTYSYCAYPVSEILKDVGETEQIEFICADGEAVAVSGEEIKQPGRVYLAEEKEGYRLVILTDAHRRRWCRQIIEIVRKRRQTVEAVYDCRNTESR